MKFENIQVFNFDGAFRGMRNPKDSWHLSDSYFGYSLDSELNEGLDEVICSWRDKIINELNINSDNTEFYEDKRDQIHSEMEDYIFKNGYSYVDDHVVNINAIGPKDMRLAKALIAGGSEHRKFMRQIVVTMDITAPLYWWKEFDTYKVGTVANSTSTMHTIKNKPITIDCFETDDYCEELQIPNTSGSTSKVTDSTNFIIDFLETLRQKYVETGDKRYWKELIRWLPESWLQKRTVTMTYENLYAMTHHRYFHKLNEWSGKDNPTLNNFIEEVKKLPYAEDLIFYGLEDN